MGSLPPCSHVSGDAGRGPAAGRGARGAGRGADYHIQGEIRAIVFTSPTRLAAGARPQRGTRADKGKARPGHDPKANELHLRRSTPRPATRQTHPRKPFFPKRLLSPSRPEKFGPGPTHPGSSTARPERWQLLTGTVLGNREELFFSNIPAPSPLFPREATLQPALHFFPSDIARAGLPNFGY